MSAIWNVVTAIANICGTEDLVVTSVNCTSTLLALRPYCVLSGSEPGLGWLLLIRFGVEVEPSVGYRDSHQDTSLPSSSHDMHQF